MRHYHLPFAVLNNPEAMSAVNQCLRDGFEPLVYMVAGQPKSIHYGDPLPPVEHNHSTEHGAMLCDVCNPEGPCCPKR